MAFYSKAHYARVGGGSKDTPAAIAERIRYRQIADQVTAEVFAKFGQLAVDNFREAMTWQENRIKELARGRS